MHPWHYRVVWYETTRTVIPHPGHALHRTREHAAAHVAYLKTRGIVARIEMREDD